jgi:hypothetical protein
VEDEGAKGTIVSKNSEECCRIFIVSNATAKREVMDMYQSRASDMFKLTLVASLFLLVTTQAVAGADAEPLASINVLTTSICDVVIHPRSFNNKVIRLRADFESDGFEHWSLVDSACPAGGVKPAGGVFDPAVAPALSEVLRHGCAGTEDKRITATWQGVYHWEGRVAHSAGVVQRWLDVQKIENLVVVSKHTGVSCPSRP